MAFDPKAYLAKKQAQAADDGGFDPVAYLAKKQAAAAPEAPAPANEASIVPSFYDTPGLRQQISMAVDSGKEWLGNFDADLRARVGGMARGVGTVLAHPIATLTEPERRRELLRGLDDTISGGYGRKLSDAITSKAPSVMQPGEESWQATNQSDQAAAPGVRQGAQVIGSFAPGMSSTIGKGANALAGRLTTSVPLRAAAAYELAAPVQAALHADAAGNRLEAARQAASDPAGLAMAAGTATLASAAQNKIRATKGAKAREFIEKEGQGAKVGLLSPGSGGVFDEDLAGVPANDKGIGIAARKGAEKVLAGLKEENRVENSEPYKTMKAKIDASPIAKDLVDVSPIVENIKAATGDLGTDDAVVGKLQRKLEQLEKYRQPPDPQAIKAATQTWYKLPPEQKATLPLEKYLADNAAGPIMVPEDQLNGLRRSLMRMAKVGMTDAPGEKEAPLRAAAFAAKQMVDEGPYAKLNQLYAQGADEMATARKQLGLKPRAPADSGIDVRKLKLSLEREGQNTKTGGGDSNLEAFRQAHPDLRAPSNLAELQRAKADLSFRLAPQHGGLIDRTVGSTLGPAAVIGTAAFGGPHGILGAAGLAAAQNATPLAGRLLYPLSRPASVNPLVWAALEDQRRKAEMAKTLRGESQ